MAELRDQLQATLGDSLILEQELGGGGMSRVFVAHEPSLGRKVVVKVLPPEMAAAVSVDRFRREIQLAAQLQHPHIVPLLSAGETQGLPFFTMPYVRGESLRARLLKGGELPLAETVRILREVASAIAYAHEAGVVHRDIKPENILISGGSAVVTDFGVAKALTASSGADAQSLTSLGVALGTPAYMAPEQATADPAIDTRADIYSLGIVAYEMITGATPFSGRSPQATLAAHVTEAPDPVSKRRSTVPPLLASLVMRCLEKHAADRPQTATDLMHELDALSTPSGGTTPTTRVPMSKPGRKYGRLIATGAGLVALVALAAFGAARVRRDTRVAAPAEIPAIAVLPFENVGRPEGREFADGMTEEITNRLSSLHGLRVIGRQSSRSYAGSTKSPQQIATELGVKYVLTGTVRWDKSSDGKDLVRVSPALLRSDDATQVWTEAYQTVLSGMFDVQSKVATEVASALNVTLLAPEKSALQRAPTDNPEAYSLFLRGDLILQSTTQPGQLREAIRLLQKATAADPKFASAWAQLSAAHTELFWFSGDPTQARLKMAKTALDKAAALAPNTADVHLARGIYLYHGQRDYERALTEFDMAEQLRPNDFNAQLYKGAVQRRRGQWEESLASMKRAVELEPRYGATILDLSSTLTFLGRYADAEPYVDRGLILNPELADGARLKATIAIEARGSVPEAVQHLRNAVTAVQPHASLTSLLQTQTWPAVEDPSLRRILIDATYSPDVGRIGDFYAAKALLFRYLGDSARTHAYADSAIAAISRDGGNTPDASASYVTLAIANAFRGRRDDALRAMNRAAELLPPSMDAFSAGDRANSTISVYTLLGDAGEAVSLIEKQVGQPGDIMRNHLRLDPLYAPLHPNPRFQRLILNRAN